MKIIIICNWIGLDITVTSNYVFQSFKFSIDLVSTGQPLTAKTPLITSSLDKGLAELKFQFISYFLYQSKIWPKSRR